MNKVLKLIVLITLISLSSYYMLLSAKGNTTINIIKPQTKSVDQEVVELLSILRNIHLREHKPNQVVEAIIRLKEIKSPLAIEELIDLIAFRRKLPNEPSFEYAKSRSISIFDRYPATDALTAIGQPALPALLNVIVEHEIDSIESENARFTILKIFDFKLTGIRYLQDAKAKIADTEKIQRLSIAINQSNEFLNNLKASGQDIGK